MREGTKVGRTVGVVTAIEEQLVNSRAPEIAIYFRTYLCANSLRERVRYWSSRKKKPIAATRLAWTAVILNSSETSGPVGHLKCTIAVYSSLSPFMISKTHISAQEPRGRQLNAKVCGCKSAIFLILSSSSSALRPLCSNNDNSKTVQVLTVILSQNWCLSQRGAIRSLSVFIAPNSPWSIKLFHALTDCCPLRRTPFSNVVRMRTRSLVPKLKTTVIGLGARLAHVKSR